MKTLSILLALAILACGLTTTSRAEDRIDERFSSQISEVIRQCASITPGMTRADLLKVFTTEGGISDLNHRTYVYASCPEIKVDVEFKLSPQTPGTSLEEESDDVITKISRPYLQLSISD